MSVLQPAMPKEDVNAKRVAWLGSLVMMLVFSVCIEAQPSPKAVTQAHPVEQHFQAAQTFQVADDLPHAAEEYRKAISVGLQHLGNVRSAAANYSDAIQLLTTSTQLDPNNADAIIDLAVAYFHTGDLAKAKSLVGSVLSREPSNFRALNLMGKLEFRQRDFQAAADHLQAALAIKADFDVAYSLALANLQLKKLPQATVLFDEMKTSMKSSPELHMLIGRAYREAGYSEQAVSEFQRAITLDPKAAHAHSQLGLTYMGEGEQKYGEAKPQFEAELAINPSDDLSRYGLGLIQFSQHDLPAAEANLKRAVQQRPSNANALLYLGRVYLEQARFEPAVIAFRKAAELLSTSPSQDPNLAQAHSFLADALKKQGKTEEAASELAVAEKLQAKQSATEQPGVINSADPNNLDQKSELSPAIREPERKLPAKNPEGGYVKSISALVGEAYHNLGVIDARQSRYSDAAAEFAEAGRWNPGITTLDRNWGVAAFRAQQFDRAIAPLERQLRRSPEDAIVRQMLGVSYFMVDDFTKSAATFHPMLGELPDNPGLLYAAGISLVRSGDSAAAGKLFSRMLERGSKVAEIHVVLGEAYSEQSEYPEALKEFQTAIQLNPQLADVHYYAGRVVFKEGKLDVAMKEFESELAVNSRSIPAMYQLAYIRQQQHQPDDAIRLLTQVLSEKPSYADAHYQLGKALLEKNDVPGAIEHLETATKLQPSESYGFYQLSIAYRRAGRLPEANQALQSYQQLKEKQPTESSPRL